MRSADHRMVTATAGHLDVILALCDEAAHWLIERGIDQWSREEVPRRWIEGRVADGSVFLLRDPGSETVGTVTVLWSDELVWGDRGADRATCTC